MEMQNTMKIIVLVKVVDFIYAQTGTDLANNNIGPDDTLRVINPLDESALEFSLRLKDRMPETRVQVLCLGRPTDGEILKRCLAMGADRAVLIDNGSNAAGDAWGRALALAAYLTGKAFDLIVAGANSIDDNEGLTGPYLADFLSLPQVSRVIAFEDAAKPLSMIVHRQLEHGNKEVLSCRLPALFTVEKGVGTVRYPALPGILRADGQSVEIISMDQTGLSNDDSDFGAGLTRITRITNPKPKKKKGADPAKSKSAAARLSFLMKPKKGGAKKTSRVINGDSKEAVDKIEKMLRDNGNIMDAATF